MFHWLQRSVYINDENYYPKVFLEINIFNDKIEYSDKEYSDEKKSHE